MKELNKDILRKAISKLPEFDPEVGTWVKIEESLEFEEKVRPILSKLPEEEPEPRTWSQISGRLDMDKKVFKLGYIRYSIALAASILLAYFSWNYFKTGNGVKEKIEYSQETVVPIDTINKPDGYERKAIEYIETSCSSQPYLCQMKDISALKTELQYINQQDQLLQEATAKYGKDADMVKNQVKLENMKSKIIKELIQKLNS